jgi:VIT1/CCC1 family predicted Fe2+/Mn2+ transporter
MTTKTVPQEIQEKMLEMQKGEVTESQIYSQLAKATKNPDNRKVLQDIGDDEHRHAERLKKHTGQELKPNRLRVFFYYWVARIFGLTFGMKLMEHGEEDAQEAYGEIVTYVPEIQDIIEDEEQHEMDLLNMLDEESLAYAGSVVLGLNDALVELTGTLAGLTFAFQDTNLIALSGLITGVAASFSMAASEYLSARAESEEEPLKAALYTGLAYIFTVFVLILPYLLLDDYLLCLVLTLVAGIIVIAVFNFYLAIAKDLSFRKRFGEMAGISLGVAAFSFGVGYIIRAVFGVDV